MDYTLIQPASHLRPYVRFVWVMNRNAVGSAKILRPIPDGCPGLLFQSAEAGTFYDQDRKPLPALCLYGQTIRHRTLYPAGDVNTVGVCFQPQGLKSIFGLDADELTDTCVDLNEFRRAPGQDLLEQLSPTASATDQVERITSYLTAQIVRTNARPDRGMTYAVDQLSESNGTVSLPKIRETLNVSERNFERRFKQHVGISPKLFARICRFQASIHQLRTRNYGKLSDIAFENGYADQSHFIRAFREFAGFSPYQYQKQASAVARNLAEWT